MYLRDRVRFPLIAIAFAALAAYAYFWVETRPSQAQLTILGPVGTAIGPGNAIAVQSTSPIQVIGSNPTRRYIEICNPTTATTVWIAPLPLNAATGGNLATGAGNGGSIPIFPYMSAPTGTINAVVNCYRTPFSPIGLSPGGYVGAGWSAIAQVNGTSPVLGALTIFEY